MDAEVPGFPLFVWYGRRVGVLVSVNYRMFWALDIERWRVHVCAGPLEVSVWMLAR